MGLMARLDVYEKSLPTGIRLTDRPAHIQSLYRLSYQTCGTFICCTHFISYIILKQHFLC
jgi:hypothetical protein